jgi:hypothetical protein
MRQTISDTQGAERLRTGLYAGAATVGRPSGVDGKNRVPRRPKMTAKETAKLNSKHFPDEIKKPLKAGGPGSGRHKVYGAITNLKTGKDIDLEGDDHKAALAKLQSLPGTTYGKHWKMAGDLDVHDKEAGMLVSHANGSEKFFGGKNAVANAISHLSKLK